LCTADEKYVSIGNISLQLKEPRNPELVPVKYSKQCFWCTNRCAACVIVVNYVCTEVF